jgi:hypothetical protein
MGLDTADCYCLAYMCSIVAGIFLILATDPGDKMKKAREKVIARRQAMAEAAEREKAMKGRSTYQRSIGTRGHGKSPSLLQRHFGAACLVLAAAIGGLQQLQQSVLWPRLCTMAGGDDGGGTRGCALPCLDAMLYLSGNRGGQTELLASVPQSWVHRDEPQEGGGSGLIIASDGTPTQASALYVPSMMRPDPVSGVRDDLYFVFFWVIAITAIRDLAFRLLFLPLARAAHVSEGMDQHKFCECAWQVLWYSAAFGFGCYIVCRSSFWFGALGGRPDWRDQIWLQTPQALHSAPIKSYYLLQLAFWVHMIVITAVEEWRADFAMMMIHHFVTVWLVCTSYAMNYVRIGILILVCHDCADIYLPLAKALRYLRANPLDDVAFAVFALAWIPTRHFLMPSIVLSIIETSPRIMSCGRRQHFLQALCWLQCMPVFSCPCLTERLCAAVLLLRVSVSTGRTAWEVVVEQSSGCPSEPKWNHEEGFYWHGAVMIPLYLLVIGLLQLLCVLWLFDIGKGVWAFVVYGEMDDHRSDEEDEDWEPPDRKKQA